MNDPIDWSHRESLLHWARLAANGHEGAQAVAAHYGLVLPPTAPTRAAPVSASVPQAPRAATPTAPRPTLATSGIQRRIDHFTRLVNPPEPPSDLT